MGHVLLETAPIAIAAAIASSSNLKRRVRAGAATVGVLTASAVLVHLSGGMIEMHFHFFVMVPVVALYQDWFPFLAAIAYVLIHHGVMGYVDPRSVYNHPSAWNNPWKWAAIHAFFIAGTSIVCLVTWKLNELAMEQRQLAADKSNNALGVLSATLESTADGILVVDSLGKMTHFNQRFIEMWDLPDPVVSTRSDHDALAHVANQLVEPDAFLNKVLDLYKSTDDSFDEIEFIDGRIFERISRPLEVAGDTAGRVWSFRDVTLRRQAERTLAARAARDRETAESLRALNESKNLLLTAVSHELRTPLTSIVGFASLLENRNDDMSDDQRLSVLQRLRSNANRLEKLVIDLFDLDRIARGIVQTHRMPVQVAALAHRVVDSLSIDNRDIEVHGGDQSANLDAGMVQRILENLLSNALKHTPPGTPIELSIKNVANETLLCVGDRGPGVVDDLKQSVFETFTQGPTPAHSPGTGLGLSLVARFAELHGGRAWVEDRPGGGANFFVLLPHKG